MGGTPRPAVAGWGTAVPSTRLTNTDLQARVDTSDAWIVERTGIRERRVAGPYESTATLASAAGTRALEHAGVAPEDVDLLVIATATPEQPVPHTGAFVGETIGLRCGSFDLGAGCAGFVYALVTAGALLTAGRLGHVLVIGAETLSRIADPDDRATCVLFGDAAASFVLGRGRDSPGPDAPGLLTWELGCDGSAAGLLEITAGGSRRPASAETVAAGEHYLKMAGQEVFRRAVRAVVESALSTLESAGVEPSQVDWLVPHQANVRIIDAARQRLGIPAERTVVNIDRYGNTSAASIPLAVAEAADDGRIEPGNLVLLSGFGAGMTWASALVRWGRP